MSDTNKVILIGTLDKEPVIRTTPKGHQVANFTIVTKEENKFGTFKEYHRCVAWGTRCESVKHYAPGTRISLDGKIKSQSYDDKKTGQKVYYKEIDVQNVNEAYDSIHKEYIASKPTVATLDDPGITDADIGF